MIKDNLVEACKDQIRDRCQATIGCDGCPIQGFDGLCQYIGADTRKLIQAEKIPMLERCFRDKILQYFAKTEEKNE